MRYVELVLKKLPLSNLPKTKGATCLKKMIPQSEKNKTIKPKKSRNNPTRKEHQRKILKYISRFFDLCYKNEKVNKADLAKECGLRLEAVTRKKSKYYGLIKEAEDKVKNPNFLQDGDSVKEFYFEIRKKLGFD